MEEIKMPNQRPEYYIDNYGVVFKVLARVKEQGCEALVLENRNTGYRKIVDIRELHGNYRLYFQDGGY